MKGTSLNLEDQTIKNAKFRHVLYTGRHSQLVLMSLKPGEDIGLETHPENDQFFRFEAGVGRVLIDDNEYTVSDGVAVIVPSGAQHNIINTSNSKDLKFYTIYSPPHHQDQIIRATKQEAESHEAEFDGKTTE